MPDNGLDTKSNIFNAALRLFAEKGYENVSVRDIADAVGIKAASIYNHYECKEQILELIYRFYLKNRYHERLVKEQYEPILRNGTKVDIMNIFNYTFETSIHENMVYAVFVIYSRVYNDTRAREIYVSEVDGAVQYIKEIFNLGIEIGRIHPFNVQMVSLVILSARLFTGHSSAIAPEQKVEWHKAHVDLLDEMARIVPFIY